MDDRTTCQHRDGCSADGVAFVEVHDGELAWLCSDHAAALDAKLEDLSTLLKSIEIRCPRCKQLAPDGLLHHTCPSE